MKKALAIIMVSCLAVFYILTTSTLFPVFNACISALHKEAAEAFKNGDDAQKQKFCFALSDEKVKWHFNEPFEIGFGSDLIDISSSKVVGDSLIVFGEADNMEQNILCVYQQVFSSSSSKEESNNGAVLKYDNTFKDYFNLGSLSMIVSMFQVNYFSDNNFLFPYKTSFISYLVKPPQNV